MAAYAYKMDFKYPVEAEKGKIELDRIRDKYQTDLIKPEHIVNESRSENAILHPIFEWDDTIGAERYRHIQAGDFVRAIVEITVDNRQVRAFHSVIITTESNSDRGYVTMDVVRNDKVLYSQVLAQAFKEFVNLKNKYEHLLELNLVFEAITKFEIPETEE
jgi:hypothetical protein